MLKSSLFKNILLFLISMCLCLVLGEFAFRWMIFGNNTSFSHLKKPGNYAYHSSDDYWKLHYRFDSMYRPPKHPHPMLGWIGYFDRKTLDHRDLPLHNKDQRPVLMYGDSFVMCQADSLLCFDEILNGDTAFSKDHFLFNYGVGGYGVDQMHLLLKATVDKFQNPFIVFSIMPNDMDRCLLSVRTGQKPYFVDTGNGLELKGLPIDSLPDRFYEEHPPEITSYIYRRLLHSGLNRGNWKFILDSTKRETMFSLNKKLILETEAQIKKRKLEYVFMIFDELYCDEGSWRTDSLELFFVRNHIPFIHSGDLVFDDSKARSSYEFSRYILQNDGHPNTHYNKLVCKEIKKYLGDYKGYKEKALARSSRKLMNNGSKEYYETRIWNNRELLKKLGEQAIAKRVSLDSAIQTEIRKTWIH